MFYHNGHTHRLAGEYHEGVVSGRDRERYIAHIAMGRSQLTRRHREQENPELVPSLWSLWEGVHEVG